MLWRFQIPSIWCTHSVVVLVLTPVVVFVLVTCVATTTYEAIVFLLLFTVAQLASVRFRTQVP